VEKEEPYGYSKTSLAPEAIDFIKTLENTEFKLYWPKPTSKECPPTGCEDLEDENKRSSIRKYKCPKCGTRISVTKKEKVLVTCDGCNVSFEQIPEPEQTTKGSEPCKTAA
jgi:DNA-directed RNA polymerase subunit RPC12/RpoP